MNYFNLLFEQILQEAHDDEAGMWKYMDYMDSQYDNIFNDLIQRKTPTWDVIPFLKLKKVWEDFMQFGQVRDEEALDEMQLTIINNIAKVNILTELSGHTQLSPENIAEERGYDWTQEMSDYLDDYMTDNSGQWRISDFALDKLVTLAWKLLTQSKPEERLVTMDMILNTVHQRSDIADWFVEGGAGSLNQLSDSPSGEERDREKEHRNAKRWYNAGY